MPDTFDLTLEAMAHGGSALGRLGQQTVFVPYTIPGERVRARAVAQKGRVLFAEGLTLLESSADRVYPACPHFGPGRCGRCHWQHIDYPAQLLLKQDVLADQLERIGGLSGVEVHPVIPAPHIWGYNFRMTLYPVDGHLGFPGVGEPGAGAAPIVPIDECHLLHPDLLALKQALDLEPIPGLEQITFQMGSDGAVMVILHTADDEAPELHTDLPMSVNLVLSDGQPVNLIGDLRSHYDLAGRRFRVTAGSPFPANYPQLQNLAAEVLAALALTGSETVLDCHAGVGLFSAFIAQQSRFVTLIESFGFAVDDADANLADIQNVDIIEGAVEDVLPELDDRCDVALLNPPPDGLSLPALDALAAQRIPRLVYLSSDPASLARDAKRLTAKGFRLVRVQPIDLSPQTYFIDSIAIFQS
jgi:23S rRNA (uracil1939-C5)-methyltransferase